MSSPPEPARRDYLAEEEARRLLTTANIQLRRGQTQDAERIVQEVLARIPHDAAAQEMLGDIHLTREDFDAAGGAYRAALEQEPGRATAEAKLARATLRQSETKRRKSLGVAYLSEGRAMLQSGEAGGGSRARIAFFSALVPGLGQILDGAFLKGGIMAGVYVLGWLLFSMTADRSTMTTLGQALRFHFASLSGSALFALLVMTLDWLYSVVDAARSRERSGH